MMWWNHGAWGAGDWWAMSFMLVVLWGMVIALVRWLVRSYRSGRGGEDRPMDTPTRAEEVLAGARGEIDEPELTRRRESLHSTRGRW